MHVQPDLPSTQYHPTFIGNSSQITFKPMGIFLQLSFQLLSEFAVRAVDNEGFTQIYLKGRDGGSGFSSLQYRKKEKNNVCYLCILSGQKMYNACNVSKAPYSCICMKDSRIIRESSEEVKMPNFSLVSSMPGRDDAPPYA